MTRIEKILVPTDFSSHSRLAAEFAGKLADEFRAELHLLHVASATRLQHEEAAGRDERIRLAKERLETVLDPRTELDISVTTHVIGGVPHHGIVQYAREHDIGLIVMGTHGRSGLAHFALGSVAEKVLRSAPCPVVVIPPEGASTLLTRASEVLNHEFGDTLRGDRDEGRSAMAGLLASELELAQPQVGEILAELEERHWIRWAEQRGEGAWVISPPVRFVEVSPGEGPVVAAFESSPALDLVQRARILRATDIHLDPSSGGQYTVRFRIDGKLEEYCRLDHDVADPMVNRMKMLAELDIAEPFTPKEGRLRLPPSMGDLEVRITTAPVAGGDAVALRLFARENVSLQLVDLGFTDQSLEAVQRILHLGEGLVLVTGPTAAGKTTTVYSMLEVLGTGARNIVSIEDPVELSAPYVRQMTVDERHGVTMTSGLRTILRMDPDIIFLGEIRDAEAADIAMRAASSGKHVFSTLHTRDVASTITAMRDPHASDRSLSGNITGIINQRLVRRLCGDCQQQVKITDEQAGVFADNQVPAPDTVHEPVGCPRCRQTGYHGRIGVFEVAIISDDIANAIGHGETEDELRARLMSAGMRTLVGDGLHKVCAGITNLAEALAVHWI